MALRALFSILEIAGIYILSKHLFEQSFKKGLNFRFNKLPRYLQLAIYIFGDKKRYESGELWQTDMYPHTGYFPLQIKLKILAPFIGFVLICVSIIGRLFL